MLYNFDIFKKYHNIQVFFSQRQDGSMKLIKDPAFLEKISQNRKIYFLKNGIGPKEACSADIVHGSNAVVVDDTKRGEIIKDADGLITREHNLFLSITSADCLPIFLFEPKKKIIGMLHTGWRSLADDILANAVGKIKKLGGAPENILAGIGPAICQKHYEVGPEVVEKFKEYPEALKKENDKIYLDLKKAAELQLLELGLKKGNVETSPECTYELSEKYFSARRDKKREVEAMIAMIGLRS